MDKGPGSLGESRGLHFPGSKYSTAMELRETTTFEEVRKMTGHSTNKAFERYCRTDGDDHLRKLYERRKSISDADNGMATEINPKNKPNQLKLK